MIALYAHSEKEYRRMAYSFCIARGRRVSHTQTDTLYKEVVCYA